MKHTVIVVGAGPAGIMAAGTAAGRGGGVILLEKNHHIGRKLRITGQGRCNLTNDTDRDTLINSIPGNGPFLHSAFHTFSNHDLMAFFRDLGLELVVERGGRVFPASEKAIDVVDALSVYLRRSGVQLRVDSPVGEIHARAGKVVGVRLKDGRELEAQAVVLASGGATYPQTGSTGDGYHMARQLGHTIIPPRPSLVPLVVAESRVKELEGLSLKNVSILLRRESGEEVYRDFGEMLFTGFGLSGPIILSASRHALACEYRNLVLSIDLKPALNREQLDARIRRDFEQFSRKQFGNALGNLLPRKMIPVIVRRSEINSGKPVHQVTRKEREKLVETLKGLEFHIKGPRPLAEGIVTCGGVATTEINPSTMESRLVKGLFFAGEVIDVDAYTGGFNLTIAFATGVLAGLNCCPQDVKEKGHENPGIQQFVR